MNLLTYFSGNSKKNQSGCGLGQNLGQIRCSGIKKVKKQALSISFFSYLHGEYLLKQKLVGVETFEGKFKTNIGR